MPLATDPPPARPAEIAARVRAGVVLLLIAALLFSLHNMTARLAYDEGIAPTTINAARTWAVAILLLVVLGGQGQWPRVPRAAWPLFAATAACYAIQNPALLIAFQHIPVSLGVLVLYVYPIIVALMAAALGQERLRAHSLAAAAVAFGGVALVLGVGGTAPDWRGVALALISAVTLSGNIVGAAQLNRHLGALGVPYALSMVGAIAFSGMMIADGGPTVPDNARGWWLLTGATIASPAALIAFYIALPKAGAPRSALTMNTEPVITVFIAMLLLGESLGTYQALGAALIVGAVAAAAVIDLKSRRL